MDYHKTKILRKINELLMLFFSILICVYPFINSNIKYFWIGTLVISINIYMVNKVKNNKLLLLLIFIIAIINISISVNDIILQGKFVADWQFRGLRSSFINNIFAENLLIFNAILNIFLNNRSPKSLIEKTDNRNTNWLIVLFSITIAFLILLYGVIMATRISNGEYTSISNPIFEYSILLWIFAWYYSHNLHRIKWIFVVYLFIYVLTFSFIGDRSSVFLYIIFAIIVFFYNSINIKNLTVISLLGIFFSNAIGLYRGSNIHIKSIFHEILEKGLYIDTVSYSYYTSLAISSLYHLEENSIKYFTGMLSSIYLKTDSPYTNLPGYAMKISQKLYNNNGGIIVGHLYAYGGYLSVIIGAIFLGVFLNKVFNSSSQISLVYQLVILVFVIRWYLYSPSIIFSAIILNTTIILFCCYLLNKIMLKKSR